MDVIDHGPEDAGRHGAADQERHVGGTLRPRYDPVLDLEEALVTQLFVVGDRGVQHLAPGSDPLRGEIRQGAALCCHRL
ncbi:hypothetical protein ACM01_11135 [Streptomyces viridochromogenes]|uniref:Uncharacterized protein n=1 Tax=Streptomyces viridochromogenes TaxID=1938 RepID=A0A0J7ZIC5_STRVR|nr:hypothetical protein ACM01_11135 [Streptomyces viridochromogenes]